MRGDGWLAGRKGRRHNDRRDQAFEGLVRKSSARPS
jgi:hypothetical protein